MSNRRKFLKQAGTLSAAGLILPGSSLFASEGNSEGLYVAEKSKWADGSKLVVSVSMQFEAGGQPDNAESPFPQNMEKGYKDLPAATW